MILSYKTPGGGSYTALCDESTRTETLELFAPSFSRVAQVEQLVRSDSVATFDRLNAACAINVVFTATYSTVALALASLATVAGLFDEINHLKIEQGATVHYYPSAVCTSYGPDIRGLSITHKLQFISKLLTATPP